MPTTVNGIGTHYYGKSNTAVRNGRCNSCGRICQLTSYDTRLWFVVVFVPLIPLGRKRVIGPVRPPAVVIMWWIKQNSSPERSQLR